MTIEQAINKMFQFGDMFGLLDIFIDKELEEWDEMERTIFAFYKEFKEVTE